jgi:orotidine-5'-phosphate decarboxylase
MAQSAFADAGAGRAPSVTPGMKNGAGEGSRTLAPLEIRLLRFTSSTSLTQMPTRPYEQAVGDQMWELERALKAEGLDGLVRGAYEAAEERFFRFIAFRPSVIADSGGSCAAAAPSVQLRAFSLWRTAGRNVFLSRNPFLTVPQAPVHADHARTPPDTPNTIAASLPADVGPLRTLG